MSSSVSLIHCDTYNNAQVEDAVRRTVEALGGIAEFVQPGQRVLLKPNLLRATAPDEAVCTHPAVVRAMVKLVQEAGATPVIGDSPGGPFNAAWLRAVYRRSGMTQVAEETGAELNWDFGQTLLPHPDGARIKGLEVGTFVTTADVVIALPKLKTHGFMQFTGATKILFGAIPGTIKMAYHTKFPEREDFGDMLVDILTLLRPALSVMDGVVGMDGMGPSGGDPFPVGALLASRDAIALDVVAASLVGMEVESIYPLQAAIRRGLTSGRVADIPVVGDPLNTFNIEGFRVPETRSRGASLIARLGIMESLGGLMKNQFVAAPSSNASCIGCGVCARSCPAEAITIVDKRARMDLKTCIRCYCCHELCPEHAIDLRKPWLGRLFG